MRPHYILFGAVFAVAVAWSLGVLLLRGVKLPARERRVLAFPVGAALLSLLNFGLCAAGLVYKGLVLAVGIAAIAVAWRALKRQGVEELNDERAPAVSGRFAKRLVFAAFAAFSVLYFFNAMAPEISPDGSSYHLGLVARYAREHGFHRITWNMYASLSQGIEMLWLEAFEFGRHSAAALVHFAFLANLALLVAAFGRRAGQPLAGTCAALFVFASPMFGVDGSSAYIDVAAASIAFTLFYLLQVWDEERQPNLLIAIGLMAGFCFAAKYTAGVAVLYAVAFVAWKSRKLRPVLTVAAAAAVMVLPWLVKNWLWVGNPVSPFFNQVFRNPYITIAFEKEYTEYLRTYGFTSARVVLWDVTVRGLLSGLLGPLFLLAPVALVALRWRVGRQLLLAAAVFGAAWFSNISTRFLIPAVPFIALAMALVFARAPKIALALVAVHALFSWPSLAALYADPGAWRLRKVPYREALRIKDEDDFLARNRPHYTMARMVERLTPRNARVLTFDGIPEAYTTRDILVAYQSAETNMAGLILWTPLVPQYAPVGRVRFEFPEQRLRRIRVVQTASTKDRWVVNELRVFRGGAELPRAPEWRLRAGPYPWNVRDAFDNSPVTFWCANQAARPNQYVEVDFAQPATAGAVVIETQLNQGALRFKLEGQDESGPWRLLSAQPQVSEAARPLGLRRAAIEELKRRGIHYMVVFRKDYGGAEFRRDMALWGLRILGEDGEGTLYEFL